MENKKIAQYTVCASCDANEFEKDMNDCIEYGFVPHGDFKVVNDEEEGKTFLWYVQLMVRYESE